MSVSSPAPSIAAISQLPWWLPRIGDFPDHYHGHTWGTGVMPNNYLFFLRSQGKQLVPQSVTHTLHHRHEFVINYAGSGNVCLGQHIYRFEPGCALLVKPGTFHRYFGVPEEGFSWLFFTFDLRKEAEPRGTSTGPIRLAAADLERMDLAARHYLNNKSELDLFEAALHIGRVLQVLGDRSPVGCLEHPHAKDVASCDLLRKITCLVDSHMDQALRVQDLADQVGMSESHLRRTFREQFGASLGEYLRHSRLTRSVQIIHRPDLSISEIASLSGFESIQAFSQSFRNAIGMPPSAYRKHLQDGKPPLRISFDSNAYHTENSPK